MDYEGQAPGGDHVVWVTNTAGWRVGMVTYAQRPVLRCWYCKKTLPIWLKVKLNDGHMPLCKDCGGAFCASQWPVSTPDGFCRQAEVAADKIMEVSDKSTGALFWRNKQDG
jgi:hypothetical protein